jgi:hypothetical protein
MIAGRRLPTRSKRKASLLYFINRSSYYEGGVTLALLGRQSRL